MTSWFRPVSCAADAPLCANREEIRALKKSPVPDVHEYLLAASRYIRLTASWRPGGLISISL